jgi:hypothetical protein
VPGVPIFAGAKKGKDGGEKKSRRQRILKLCDPRHGSDVHGMNYEQ